MGPKVAAACRFAERTRRVAAIGALDQAEMILAEDAGTIVAVTAPRLDEPSMTAGGRVRSTGDGPAS
jgi:hypothetical protein